MKLIPSKLNLNWLQFDWHWNTCERHGPLCAVLDIPDEDEGLAECCLFWGVPCFYLETAEKLTSHALQKENPEKTKQHI